MEVETQDRHEKTDAMYADIDALTGENVDATLGFLRSFVDGSPSGDALARRIALTRHGTR